MSDKVAEVTRAALDNATDDYARSLRVLRGRASERGSLVASDEDMEAQQFLFRSGARRHRADVPYDIIDGEKVYLAPYHNEDGEVRILNDIPFEKVQGRLAEMTGKTEEELFFHVIKSPDISDILNKQRGE